MAKTDVKVPDIGDSKDVPIIEILVKDGDRIEKDAALLVLESEKATMEVPAPSAGIVRGIKVKVGDKLNSGDVILALESDDAPAVAPPPAATEKAAPTPPSATAPAKDPAPAPSVSQPSAAQIPAARLVVAAAAATSGKTPWDAQAGVLPHASPSIRKLAREFGVDLSGVRGTGPKERITQDDVQKFVKGRLSGAPSVASAGGIPAIPAVDFSQFGEIENKPLARIRKISAQYVHRAWLNIPHVTQNDEADITELEAFRKSQSEEAGVKLTLLPFIMKAVAAALKQYPEFNSSLAPDGESLILKKYCHIGFAADTPNGLVVPVVRDVWNKGIVQLATECGELAKKARDGKLKPDEMKGGCFSISSLGGIGGSHFTPIVNAPEVGILGVSRAQMKPVWDGKEFQPRLMCPLSLSYDHRVIDGAYAARFIVALVKIMADLRRLAL